MTERHKQKKKNKRNLRIILPIVLLMILVAVYFAGRFFLRNDLNACSVENKSEPELVRPYPGQLNIYCLDVGQGDCTLIVSPNGKTMLIDAADRDRFPMIENTLRGFGIESLDAVVATHPHYDHIGGMLQLFSKFSVKTLVVPDVLSDLKPADDLLKAAQNCGITVLPVMNGDKLEWDKECGIDILSPVIGCDYSESNPNDWCIILRVTYKNRSMLFAADATVHAEQLAMFHNEKEKFKADVLRVGHHGSLTSSSYGFIETVSPDYAVISVGKDNDYGHPDDVILSRLNALGAEVLRTDLNGTVMIFTDGEALTMDCTKNSPFPKGGK